MKPNNLLKLNQTLGFIKGIFNFAESSMLDALDYLSEMIEEIIEDEKKGGDGE